jgi:hypothetical protein
VSAGSDDITTLGYSFGPDNNLLLYSCASFVLVPPISNLNQLVQCTLPLASGLNLRIGLTAASTGAAMILANSSDTFGYMTPTIHANTLRSNTSGLVATATLEPPTSNALTVEFDGAFFVPSAALTTVTYGPISNPNQYQCVFSPARSTYTTISCTTQDYSQAEDMRFTVYLAGNQLPVTGTDTISYFPIPQLFSIAGCTPNGNATMDCPTEGGVSMLLTGTDFTIASTVLVGGSQCGALIFLSSKSMRCTLPSGTGTGISVTINAGGQLSVPKNFVSYSGRFVVFAIFVFLF